MRVFQLRFSDAVLDRYAWEICDFLAEAGEAIEERRFTGVRRAHDCYDNVAIVHRTGRWQDRWVWEETRARGVSVAATHEVDSRKYEEI